MVFSDHSTAVWRTIGNWVRLVTTEKDINLAFLELILITNASVEGDSGISNLGLSEEDRDRSTALTKLTAVAISSENQTSKKDREDFLALDEVVRLALVRAIRVVQNSPNLAALGSEIDDLLQHPHRQPAAVLARLPGTGLPALPRLRRAAR